VSEKVKIRIMEKLKKYRGYRITIMRHIVQIISFIMIFGGIIGYAATAIVLPIRTGLSNPYLIVADAWSLLEIMLALCIVPLIVIASISLFSIIIGRTLCGWVCPFGFINDVVGALGRKRRVSPATSIGLWKFALFLAGIWIIIDVSIYYNEYVGNSIRGMFGEFGYAPSTFLDPVSTLFGLLFWYNYHNLWPKEYLDFFYMPKFFYWRVFFLVMVFLGMLYIQRFYCRTLCPLGAIMGLAGQYAFLHLSIDAALCDECKVCEYVCPMGVPILKYKEEGEIRSPLCIMCLKCLESCPKGAIRVRFR